MTDDLLTISSATQGAAGLTARVNPLGAELWSLTDGAGAQFMTDADPAFWTGHAPVLFPIIGELAGGQYRLGERTFAMARHGFARRSLFTVVEHGVDCLRLRLTDSAETRAVYPFAFVLEMAFRVEGMALHIAATVTNGQDVAMPFSLGFHPAFAWPLPGGAAKSAHCVVFAQPEPEDVRRLDAKGLVLPQGQPTPVQGRELALSAGLFEADALIWDRPHSRALSYGADDGAWLDIAFDMPSLGVWQKPGAPFLCIEPWAGQADPQGFTCDFTQKPGIETLAPRESRSFHMEVNVRPPGLNVRPLDVGPRPR